MLVRSEFDMRKLDPYSTKSYTYSSTYMLQERPLAAEPHKLNDN
jgi:hypothetical protein